MVRATLNKYGRSHTVPASNVFDSGIQMPILDACKLITAEKTSRSIGEWYVRRRLLMLAVNKMQQAAGMITAVLGCIPFVGKIAGAFILFKELLGIVMVFVVGGATFLPTALSPAFE